MKNRNFTPLFAPSAEPRPALTSRKNKSLELGSWRLRRYTPPPYATPKTGL